ncbi:uncharacterized protein N7503_001681 [Penicillium pulvis]|uniref:uncharacterized protein n=1 Tax=Penicillium pulvis TaxID=1562058 RepID=UPI002548AD31|nr:uncharacterized protein N7503_001681 [Penicillium pulvis]KAJ5809463.1 hypothetical protein N7503_001681 [Penicillium pulvis]
MAPNSTNYFLSHSPLYISSSHNPSLHPEIIYEMMSKKEFYTKITPLPPNIPRQLALDILHSHSEIITLNPLVLSHNPIKAPRNASADEYYSTWYEIFQRVQYLPGFGKMGSGKISFKGCFENHPWGVKAHTYPPMGIDLLSNFRVEGTQLNEVDGPDSKSRPDLEQRIPGAPANGLYLLEEVEIKCNITLMAFVKSQLKAASKVLVDRLIKKAELLDAGVLQAMFEDGTLRTFNPADRTQYPMQPPMSPTLPHSPTGSSRWGGSISSSGHTNSIAPSYGTEYRRSLNEAVELPDTSAVNRGLPFTRFDKGFPTELPAMEEVQRDYK